MKYRTFGKQGYEVSLLGMGVMRLPKLTAAGGGFYVNREEAYELLRYAADHGVNYFDTAFTYHAMTSEEVLGEALEGGRRKKVKLATKLPVSEMKEPDNIRRCLEGTLRKLRTDYLDVYMIHGIGPGSWDTVKERKVIETYEKLRAEGMIKTIGFSYHGNYDNFKEVISAYDWGMCLVQQNMIDFDREVTDRVYELMAGRGTALAVMEPLRGGGLAGAPEQVRKVYEDSGKTWSPSEWAFRYLIDRPEVSVIVSGMSTLEQLKENIAVFSKDDAAPGRLTPLDKETIAKARDAYNSVVNIPCTACDYCMPCSSGVNIPGIFSFYNDAYRFEYFDTRRRSYMFTARGGADFSRCTDCGECEPKCPQKIGIRERLSVAHDALKGWTEVAE